MIIRLLPALTCLSLFAVSLPTAYAQDDATRDDKIIALLKNLYKEVHALSARVERQERDIARLRRALGEDEKQKTNRGSQPAPLLRSLLGGARRSRSKERRARIAQLEEELARLKEEEARDRAGPFRFLAPRGREDGRATQPSRGPGSPADNLRRGIERGQQGLQRLLRGITGDSNAPAPDNRDASRAAPLGPLEQMRQDVDDLRRMRRFTRDPRTREDLRTMERLMERGQAFRQGVGRESFDAARDQFNRFLDYLDSPAGQTDRRQLDAYRKSAEDALAAMAEEARKQLEKSGPRKDPGPSPEQRKRRAPRSDAGREEKETEENKEQGEEDFFLRFIPGEVAGGRVDAARSISGALAAPGNRNIHPGVVHDVRVGLTAPVLLAVLSPRRAG